MEVFVYYITCMFSMLRAIDFALRGRDGKAFSLGVTGASTDASLRQRNMNLILNKKEQIKELLDVVEKNARFIDISSESTLIECPDTVAYKAIEMMEILSTTLLETSIKIALENIDLITNIEMKTARKDRFDEVMAKIRLTAL